MDLNKSVRRIYGTTIYRSCPSSTAVKYTISNRPEKSSVGLAIRYIIQILLGTLCAAMICLRTVNSSKVWKAEIDCSSGVFGSWCGRIVVDMIAKCILMSGLEGPGLASGQQKITPTSGTLVINFNMVILLSGLLLLLISVKRPYTEDSILVVHGFGIQLSSSGTSIFNKRSEFIPMELVQDVIINEGFRNFSVIFFLAVMVKGRNRLLVVFPNLLPRRSILEEIWRDIKRCMYQSPPVFSALPFDLTANYIKNSQNLPINGIHGSHSLASSSSALSGSPTGKKRKGRNNSDALKAISRQQ
ncbi:GPI-GlcNAc transferase complex, PIG-H component-domain-containing protein [Dipodascopsis uninucleata]